jgi:S1-C subfamily serine protease
MSKFEQSGTDQSGVERSEWISRIRSGLSQLRSISLRTIGLIIAIGLVIPGLGASPSWAQSTEARLAARPLLAASQSFVADADQLVGPAVVRIDTERTVTRGVNPMIDDPILRRFFGEELPGRMPREEHQRGQGSGFIIDKAGIVLTNAHVVDQADRVRVRLTDGRDFEGVVKGVDRVTDLAVVAIKPSGEVLPVAPLGNSSGIRVGDWAIAIGNPFGLDNTVTLGIISTLRRPSSEVGISDKRIDFIQTDAAINPGNSGGPLVNGSGEVIGINTAIRADANGIGFAIPIDKAKSIQATLLKNGKVAHPYLGIQMVTLTPQLAEENNRNPNADRTLPAINGALVTGVLPNSPAAAAGLRRGDVIVQLEGDAIKSANQLQQLVDRSNIGQSLQVKVRRGPQTQQFNVRTAELQEMTQ